METTVNENCTVASNAIAITRWARASASPLAYHHFYTLTVLYFDIHTIPAMVSVNMSMLWFHNINRCGMTYAMHPKQPIVIFYYTHKWVM
jgi:hypothetical protein